MRQLTLNEKISIKGLLQAKGVNIPKLTMKEALFFWRQLYGISISKWFKVTYRKRTCVKP